MQYSTRSIILDLLGYSRLLTIERVSDQFSSVNAAIKNRYSTVTYLFYLGVRRPISGGVSGPEISFQVVEVRRTDTTFHRAVSRMSTRTGFGDLVYSTRSLMDPWSTYSRPTPSLDHD